MSISESHRAHAAHEREAAATAELPNVRALRLRSAEVWDEMAVRADRVEQMLAMNMAAKAARG